MTLKLFSSDAGTPSQTQLEKRTTLTDALEGFGRREKSDGMERKEEKNIKGTGKRKGVGKERNETEVKGEGEREEEFWGHPLHFSCLRPYE